MSRGCLQLAAVGRRRNKIQNCKRMMTNFISTRKFIYQICWKYYSMISSKMVRHLSEILQKSNSKQKIKKARELIRFKKEDLKKLNDLWKTPNKLKNINKHDDKSIENYERALAFEECEGVRVTAAALFSSG
ncbi:hypothetical protein RhiirA5_374076 [Rhizophagus irregularis]|uniref:Uncharacterized protein n=1 Tax=Rhizophagus irregularis TaxID=588596 RepID=A0A2I1DTK4_9GLOM|nr:hypothetical protein RhiirA5_374076 [Rhizophagus irregularis]PKC75908.1 hypothetical protein RhiirA1_386886 [Rhizophagus irregularis]PKY13206.1 hypothetical protein RhiirB3_379092 [Rhizophagus irregularis]